MFTINEYHDSLGVIDELGGMYKTGGEANFALRQIAPQSIKIEGEWLKANKTAVPYLVDVIFRIAKVFGNWGSWERGKMQTPPSAIDSILNLDDCRIHQYDLSGSEYALVVLDKVLTSLGVKHEAVMASVKSETVSG